jgi:flagellar biosynthesis/type III secretory pathway protein FliH
MRPLVRSLEDFGSGSRRRESDADRALKAAVAAARGEGHAAGYAEGFAAALAQAATEEHALLLALRETLRDLELVQTAARAEALAALHPVVEAILRIAAPKAAEAGLAGTVADAVARRLDRGHGERLLARVAPAAADDLRSHFAPDIIGIEPDPAIAPGSVRLEWQGGGALFDAAAALAEAEAAVSAFFGTATVAPGSVAPLSSQPESLHHVG